MNQNSNKRLMINLLANIVSYTANILIAFILTPYLINTLGKETYSFYPIANNFVAYLCVLTNALNSMSSRFVTICIVNNKWNDAQKYVSSILFSNIIMGMILLFPMMLIVIFIDCIMDVPINIVASVRMLFAFVFASMLVNIISSVYGIATFVKNRIDLRSAMQLVSGILKITLFYLLFKYLEPNIVYVGLVAFVVAVSESIFQLRYFRKLLSNIKISIKNFSVHHVVELLSSGCWNSVNAIGSLLLVSSSIAMANIIYGVANGGIYSIVNTVPLFINGVISMLTGVFAPMVTYSYAKGDVSELLHNIEKAQSLIGIISCSVLIVFIWLSKQFFTLWTPSEDAELLFQLSLITIIPHFFIACIWPINNMNIAANKVKQPALVQLFLGVLNILLVIALSHFFHTGVFSICVICSMLTLIFVVLFLPCYAAYYLQVSYSTFYKVVVRMLLSILLLSILFFIIIPHMNFASWPIFMFNSLVLGCIAFLVNFLFISNKQTKHNLFIMIKQSPNVKRNN